MGCGKLDGFKPSSLTGEKIHIPRQRAGDFSSKSLSCSTTNACFSTSCFVPGRGRFIGNDFGFFARQNFLTGQTPHFGWRGRQTSAPRSRSAELYAARAFFGVEAGAAVPRSFLATVESDGIR